MSAEAIVCVVADRLREILASCPNCQGGQVTVVLVAHRIANPLAERGLGNRYPVPHVQVLPSGAASFREPCITCWRLRQVVELAENYQ